MAEPTKIWYTIEVLYRHDNEVKREAIRNVSPQKLIQFREIFFSVGFAVTIDASHQIIIAPWNIRSIDVWRQDKFFKG